MTSIHMKKLAGYIIFGPIIALTSYFIQPGGVLGIGGTADPTISEEVIKILSENSALGIISAMTVMIGLLTIFSGYIYLANSIVSRNSHKCFWNIWFLYWQFNGAWDCFRSNY